MAIARTDANRELMIREASEAVLRWQYRVPANAEVHKQRAVDQSVPLAQLQQSINDMLSEYESKIRAPLRQFRDVTVPADPGFLTVSDKLALTLESVGTIGAAVADQVDIFAAMPRTSYAEIITACDYLIANVNKPESVFPR